MAMAYETREGRGPIYFDGFRSAVAADKSLVQQYSNVLRQLRLSVDISHYSDQFCFPVLEQTVD